MNKPFCFFLGIDVSKDTLDFALNNSAGKVVLSGRIPNDPSSWDKLSKSLSDSGQWGLADLPSTLVCAEFTGMYTYHVMSWVSHHVPLWLESGKQIKYSQGIVRGKDDATDARRIAVYAQKEVKNVRLWQPLGEVVEKLRLFTALRDRLVKAMVELSTPLKEQKRFVAPAHFDLLEQISKPSIDALGAQIKEVEAKINELIDSDDEISQLKKNLQAIPGIGPVVSAAVIAKTGGLKLFENARKLACQAGIAPFPYRSGTSVRAKTQVSHHADKELKKLLHLAAMAAIKTKGTLQDYYDRKVKEGKPKLLVFNNVRNKIVHLIFATAKKNILYDKNFVHNLAKS